MWRSSISREGTLSLLDDAVLLSGGPRRFQHADIDEWIMRQVTRSAEMAGTDEEGEP